MGRKKKEETVVVEELVHGVPKSELDRINDVLDAITEDPYTGLGTLSKGTVVHRNFNKESN